MSNLEKERTCADCGNPFTLAQHALVGAEAVADQLDAGTLSEDDLPDIARRCPDCHGTEKMDTKKATVAMFRLEHAAKQARGRQIPRAAKLGVLALAMSGTGGLLVAQLYAGRNGAGAVTTTMTVLSATLIVAAIAMGVVAVAGNFARKPTETESKLEQGDEHG